MLALLLPLLAAGHTGPSESFELSNTLGNGMVLQRDGKAMVWGYGSTGSVTTTTFGGKTYTATTAATGIWRQALPPTAATKAPQTIGFKNGKDAATLTGVLFGDVFLCGGQSNMQYTPHSMAGMNNLTAELAAADAYGDTIRFFTVGQKNQSTTPFTNLASIEEKWSPASTKSLGGTAWDTFSGVCWLFGRDIHDGLGGTVPIGLISNNWGGTSRGTPVQSWSSAAALSKCDGGKAVPTDKGGNLYGGMIHPYTIGPMALKGFTWYQGEANVGNAAYYACQFPAMIEGWRADFQAAGADSPLWFGFVQIAGYNYGNGTRSLAAGDLRQAQLAALKLPNVGMSTAVDTGDFLNIHPPDKQTVGSRLANQALEMIYKKALPQSSLFPIYSGSKQAIAGNSVSVTVTLKNTGTGITTVAAPAATASSTLGKPNSVPRNQCVTANAVFAATKGVDSSSCGHPMIYGADGTAITATAAVSTDKTGIVLTAASAPAGFKPIATSYGRGSWAVTTFYNSAGLPVLPWYANITATELPMDFGWAQDAVGASQRWDGAGLPAVSYSP